MLNYKKKTQPQLPSMEGALGTLNILKDPPKSIHTRYIEKVGVNNKILDQIDDSGERVCAEILPVARGINPMVDVDYRNSGSYGSQMFAGSATANQTVNASESYYPYRIMDKGAFRPPVKAPIDNLPLSRLPRNVTNMEVNKGSNQLFSQVSSAVSCRPDMKALRDDLLNVCVNTNKQQTIETPVNPGYQVKYIANKQNPVVAARTNLINREFNPSLGANPDTLNYLNQYEYKPMQTNLFKPMDVPVQYDILQPPVKDRMNTAVFTNVSDVSQQRDISSKEYVGLKNNLPQTQMMTNKHVKLERMDLNRDVYLPERQNLGSFQTRGTQPMLEHPQVPVRVTNDRSVSKGNKLMRERFF